MSSRHEDSNCRPEDLPTSVASDAGELEHLQAILKSIDAIIWEFEASTLTTTYVSPQLETILGYSLEQAADDPHLWKKIIHPSDLPRVLREVEEKVEHSSQFALEYQALTAEGEVLWLRDITTVVRRENAPTLFRCVLTDATAEHEAAVELERNRRRLADAQRIARTGDWEWDVPTDEVTWSDECFRIFGLEPQSAHLNLSAYQNMLDPATQKMVQDSINRTLEEGAPFVVEHPLMRPDGVTITVRCFGEVIRNEAGEPICLRGTVQDITESRELEQLKDDLIALVSHELRTPLTPLVGLLSLLSSDEELQNSPRLARMINMASNNARRLVEVVDALLEIRELTGEPEKSLTVETVDLKEVVLAAINKRPALPETHSISMAPPVEDVIVRGDRVRLCEVVVNLLSNAAKFSPNHTTIKVSVEADGEQARVNIRDYGKGIPDGLHDRLFDRFTQADGPQSRNYGGIGLGLAISKAIVDRHRGRIGFERPEDGGTLVFIELPLASPSPAR